MSSGLVSQLWWRVLPDGFLTEGIETLAACELFESGVILCGTSGERSLAQFELSASKIDPKL